MCPLYCIHCCSCGLQYIGETKRTFCIRFKEHQADTTYNRDTPIAHHFNQTGHTKSNMIPQIIELRYKRRMLTQPPYIGDSENNIGCTNYGHILHWASMLWGSNSLFTYPQNVKYLRAIHLSHCPQHCVPPGTSER